MECRDPQPSFPLPAVSPVIRRVGSRQGEGGIGLCVPLPRSFSNCRLRPRHRRTMAFPWVIFGLRAENIAGVGQKEEVQGDRRLCLHV